MISSSDTTILFDDRSLLEAALGDKALMNSSINANCDCDGYYANQNDEDYNPHPGAPSTAAIN
jgi:hypothetical protein